MSQALDSNGEQEPASKPVTFGLYPMDSHIQTRLLDACRTVLPRATPEQIRDLSYLIHALQRLPSTTPGVDGSVSLTTRYDKSSATHGFNLNSYEFILTTGESMNFGQGWDHESSNVLEVRTEVMRSDEDGDDFREWLNIFCDQAKDPATEIDISCDANYDLDLSNDTQGISWEENPLLAEGDERCEL